MIARERAAPRREVRAEAPALAGGSGRRPLHHLEAVLIGVAVVDEDGVVAGDARPALDRGDDGVVVADAGALLDAAVEQAADDALVDEFVVDLEPALGPV